MKGGLKSIVMLNLCSTAARRLAKNSPLDYCFPATQCRSLCVSIYTTFRFIDSETHIRSRCVRMWRSVRNDTRR